MKLQNHPVTEVHKYSARKAELHAVKFFFILKPDGQGAYDI